MKRRAIAAGAVLTLFGIAAVQAHPSMPTPTPAPVARDSAAGPPRDQSASQVLADTAAQYDAIEGSIEALQKTIADQKADIAALNAKIQEINKKIEELRQMQDKLNKASARLASKEQKANAAKLSKKISAQEAKAQELRESLILRLTPAPKKATPKP